MNKYQAGDIITDGVTIVQALQEYVDDLVRRKKGFGFYTKFISK